MVAPACDRATHEQFIMAHAIEVTRIQQIDAGIDGSLKGGDALGIICGSVWARHPHTTQANGKHCRPRLAKSHGFAITSHVRSSVRIHQVYPSFAEALLL